MIYQRACTYHSIKKPVITMLTYPWKCTVLHCYNLGNSWKPLVLMTRHFDYCPNASEGDNQSVRSSAPVVSRCFPGGLQCKTVHFQGWVSMVVTGFFAQCVNGIFFLFYICTHISQHLHHLVVYYFILPLMMECSRSTDKIPFLCPV